MRVFGAVGAEQVLQHRQVNSLTRFWGDPAAHGVDHIVHAHPVRRALVLRQVVSSFHDLPNQLGRSPGSKLRPRHALPFPAAVIPPAPATDPSASAAHYAGLGRH